MNPRSALLSCTEYHRYFSCQQAFIGVIFALAMATRARKNTLSIFMVAYATVCAHFSNVPRRLVFFICQAEMSDGVKNIFKKLKTRVDHRGGIFVLKFRLKFLFVCLFPLSQ